MALSETLETINNALSFRKCAYQALVDSMKPDERKALENAWEKGYSQRVILRALRAEGYKTSNEAISGHRSGQCKCPKS